MAKKRYIFVTPPSNDAVVGGEVWTGFWWRGIAETVPPDVEVVMTTASKKGLGIDPAPGDVVVLTRWPLFVENHLRHCHPGQAVLCEFGTRHGYSIGLWDVVSDWAYKHRSVGAVVCLTDSFADWHRREYKIPASIPVIGAGLPIPSLHTDALASKPWIGHEKTALFPQRIEDDTNPMFAVMLATHLMSEGYKVTFSTPDEIDDKWPVQSWRRLGIAVHAKVRGDDYQKLLTSHRVAISTGFQGSTWVAGYESWRAGGIPIAPGGTPPFCDPYSLRYDPLSAATSINFALSSARKMPHVSLVDTRWFSGNFWWHRVRKAMERG
jgi:hypothetical protein